MEDISEDQWIEWLDRLSENDYLVVDNFISDRLYHKIRSYFDHLMEENEFSKAGIGDAGHRQIESSVRGDFIYWLDRNRDNELSDFFDLVEVLISKIKRYCYLSISDYEFHLAHYPAGTRYEKHIDQFHGRTNRILSVLIYLNEDWKPQDAGELKIYDNNSQVLVEPIAKRLVIFKSNSVEHEVLKTNSGRKSVTGWLLRQPASLGQLFS